MACKLNPTRAESQAGAIEFPKDSTLNSWLRLWARLARPPTHLAEAVAEAGARSSSSSLWRNNRRLARPPALGSQRVPRSPARPTHSVVGRHCRPTLPSESRRRPSFVGTPLEARWRSRVSGERAPSWLPVNPVTCRARSHHSNACASELDRFDLDVGPNHTQTLSCRMARL